MRRVPRIGSRYVGDVRTTTLGVGILVVLAGCSSTATSPETTTSPIVTDVTTSAVSEPPVTEAPPSSEPIELEQPALWPDPSEVFTSPQSVAEDFLLHALGVPPVIGEFMAGDARSGEIAVFSPGDVETLRAILLMRQLGPSNGWFIIGTINDNAVISKPPYGAEVSLEDAQSLVVEGMAEGFEASLTVYAFVAGRAEPILDQETTMGGNFGVPGPFQVTLDLTGVEPGDTVVLLVRGGVGLETDPGEFGAIPILITK